MTTMEGDRVASALARIEAAAERISRGAAAPAKPDPELSRKYMGLRSETETALAELDRLIAEMER